MQVFIQVLFIYNMIQAYYFLTFKPIIMKNISQSLFSYVIIIIFIGFFLLILSLIKILDVILLAILWLAMMDYLILNVIQFIIVCVFNLFVFIHYQASYQIMIHFSQYHSSLLALSYFLFECFYIFKNNEKDFIYIYQLIPT